MDADQTLYAFRGAYGRFATVAAQALANGTPERDVREAMRMNGTPPPQTRGELCRIRDHAHLSMAVNRAADDAGHPMKRRLDVLHEARSAAEQEWGVTLPIPATVSAR